MEYKKYTSKPYLVYPRHSVVVDLEKEEVERSGRCVGGIYTAARSPSLFLSAGTVALYVFPPEPMGVPTPFCFFPFSLQPFSPSGYFLLILHLSPPKVR